MIVVMMEFVLAILIIVVPIIMKKEKVLNVMESGILVKDGMMKNLMK